MFVNSKHEEAYKLLQTGKYEAALQGLNEALQLNPGHPDILSDRGVVYLHLGEKLKCMEDFQLALEMQPEYGFRYAARAYAKERFGDLQGAVEDYEEAIRLDPEDAISYNNLGLLQEKMGYQKQAEINFQRADELSKQEKHLLDVIEDLEQDHSENQTEERKEQVERNPISPEVQRESQISAFNEFKKVFTSKKQFQQFMQFIKNGFRLK